MATLVPAHNTLPLTADMQRALATSPQPAPSDNARLADAQGGVPQAQSLSAWRIPRYGAPGILVPVTRPMPEPGPGEVLIKIEASGVTRADGMMRAGTPKFARLFLGLRRPRQDLIGTCLSGRIIAVGSNVTRFSVGDEVFGEAGLTFGANASHICLKQDGVLMHKPASLTHEQAAGLCDGALTSYNFLHNVAKLKAGERLLILGGSGSLGSAAVQIAKAMGAEVTATCSARNVDLVASLGADHVIDYNRHNALDKGAGYDVIYDTLGVASFAAAKRALQANGRYVCPVLSLALLGAMMRTRKYGARKARFSATGLLAPEVLRSMLSAVIDLCEAGKFSPLMDRSYPLEQLIEAQRYMETGHKRGNVVVVR